MCGSVHGVCHFICTFGWTYEVCNCSCGSIIQWQSQLESAQSSIANCVCIAPRSQKAIDHARTFRLHWLQTTYTTYPIYGFRYNDRVIRSSLVKLRRVPIQTYNKWYDNESLWHSSSSLHVRKWSRPFVCRTCQNENQSVHYEYDIRFTYISKLLVHHSYDIDECTAPAISLVSYLWDTALFQFVGKIAGNLNK